MTPIRDIWPWVFGAFWWFFLFFSARAASFIRFRDAGPPRVRIDLDPYLMFFTVATAITGHLVAFVAGLPVFLACTWLNSRASRKELSSWGEDLNRGPAGRTVRIIPDLSRRLVDDYSHPLVRRYPLLLPRVLLDRLNGAEVDALLARQAAPRSPWPVLLAWLLPIIAEFFGSRVAPPSLAPVVSIASILCLWALNVWAFRRLDAQADAKAVQATRDLATYIQALLKADRLMNETPPRLRMSTWWLFPASLDARIAAIKPRVPEASQL